MKTTNLTIKQEKFCQAYIRLGDKNPLNAYKEVFACARLKDETIQIKADSELKSKFVRLRIKELKAHLGGRPTLYKDEYNEQAYKLCLLGATDKDMADFFEVVESTVNLWKKEYPKFSESIHAGKAKADMEVASSLYQTTQDRTVTEQMAFKVKKVFYNEDGKRIEQETIEIVDVEKQIPADFRSQQFWLKNRKSDKWRDKQEVDHTTNGKEMQPIIGMRIVNESTDGDNT